MPVNIGGFSPSQSNTGKTQNSDPVTRIHRYSQQSEAGSLPEGDRVELSEQANQLHSLEHAIKAAPAIDAEKVERIKDALAKGEYHINYERLAQTLQQFDRLLSS